MARRNHFLEDRLLRHGVGVRFARPCRRGPHKTRPHRHARIGVLTMMAPSARLAGARYTTPLRQGDLSNLCGLYAVLNAVQLACWRVPPSSDQLRELLVFGVRYLTK